MLHGFSVGDYAAHDRSPRRIDFQLRALASIQAKLIPLNIPIYTTIWRERKQVPEEVAKLMLEWGATHLFANLEYEVDELGRDRKVVERVIRARQTGEGWDGKVEFLHDFCVIKPGRVLTQVCCCSRLTSQNVLTSDGSKGRIIPSSRPSTRIGLRSSSPLSRRLSQMQASSRPTRSTKQSTTPSSSSSSPPAYPSRSRGSPSLLRSARTWITSGRCRRTSPSRCWGGS